MRKEKELPGSSSGFDYIVLSPAGTAEASMAIAATRAGALGMLNLEFAHDTEVALAALTALSKHARGPFAVLVDAAAADLLDAVLDEPADGLEIVALTNPSGAPLTAAVNAIRRDGRRVWLSVTSLEDARLGEEAGIDALIAKGNEAGGWVGDETAFVLLQRLLSAVNVPIYVQGGIGMHTAPACFAAGASGVVLDNQLLLTRESPLVTKARTRIESMDGSETQVVGGSSGTSFRAYSRADAAIVEVLRQIEAIEALADEGLQEARATWRKSLNKAVDWRREGAIWAVGQDAAFAAGFASRYSTVGGVLRAMRDTVRKYVSLASAQPPLAENSPLAESHGTRYPIVQGPMTRVSDRPAFAAAVAEAGGLPFLALALMRTEEIRPILEETRDLLKDRSWGVGILGFVPPDLRAEQLDVIRSARPPFALIAGGQPHQARLLEAEGIPTYLHVPSPGLLSMFLDDGARRFVFEGRECGGHVGPRTSFVLWESMIEVLLDYMDRSGPQADFHVLFAGGIHDALSAQMVATMAMPLVIRGVKIGVLLGTAYLFTEEAVASGAIKNGFQQAALGCSQTVILQASPGYSTRCVPSPFCDTFEDTKRRLILAGTSGEVLKEQLEELNIGRLRIASKGVDRNPLDGRDTSAPRLISVGAEEQWQQGMYMIGQVAALRDRTVTIAELHAEISTGSTRRLGSMPQAREEDGFIPPQAAIAIVGMASILPGAPDLQTFWANILNKVDAITEVPAERWDTSQYFDADRNARDKVYSRWGGFIDDVAFDPIDWGMPPSSLKSIEPFQLLALEIVRRAIEDAGYTERPFARERTSVIMGAGGGTPDLTAGYVVRSSLPGLFGAETAEKLTGRLEGVLPEWTEDSFAGLLMNVAAGRVANRFDFGGVNYTVDAACASSLAAVYLGVRDLEARTSDVVIVGGVESIQNPFDFFCFGKTQALSPSGRSRPFDEDADGIAISEGFAALVLKRLEDAERDGDRIYSVIRGVGGSSDGRDKGLTAPRPEGQMRALRRAYEQARFSPASIGLIEAHGTGTAAGDQAEVQSLTSLFTSAGAARETAAIGSVKSMIGHTKATAGVASMIKVAKSLHHRVLPPTLGVVKPNSKANFRESPFYVNTEARPWVQDVSPNPRRAGVSAFGFGGTNFHVVLEEYTGAYLSHDDPGVDHWPAEIFLWRGSSRKDIRSALDDLLAKLEAGAKPRLCDLAFTVSLRAESMPGEGPCLALVAESLDDLIERIREAREILESGLTRAHTLQGVHYTDAQLAVREGSVAFLFPGQGSHYVNMARELAVIFPEARAAFDEADRVLAGRIGQPISRYIFPPPAFTAEEERAHQTALTDSEIAQPALGATELAMLRLLRSMGVEPAMTAGHSYGELVALHAAGAISAEALIVLSETRGRAMAECAIGDSGSMAAVMAPPQAIELLLSESNLTLANLNSPSQTVISGPTAAIDAALRWCSEHKLTARRLPVACAFHSPLVAPAQRRFAELLVHTRIAQPHIPVFSNTTASVYPDDAEAMTALLARHLAQPVNFVGEVEAMYEAGARVFVEVGPKQVLSGLVGQILGDRLHVSIALDGRGRGGLSSLLNAAGALASEGIRVNTDRFFRGRRLRRIDLAHLEKETGESKLSPSTWMVSGAGVRRAGARSERADLPLRIELVEGAQNATAHAPENAPTFIPTAPAAPSSLSSRPVEVDRKSSKGAGARQHDPAELVPPMPPHDGQTITVGADEVMNHFQQVMQRFLQVQQSVMLASFEGAEEPVLDALGGEEETAPEVLLPSVDAAPALAVPSMPGYPVVGTPIHTNGDHPMVEPSPTSTATESQAGQIGAVAADNSGIGRDDIARQLLAIVSDRTGYPIETLAIDANLEADLGVDSIKRVEIAGAIIRALSSHFVVPPEVERLTAVLTIGSMVDELETFLSATAGLPSGRADEAPTTLSTPDSTDAEGVERLLLRPAHALAGAIRAGLARDGVIVILDDAAGIGERLSSLVQRDAYRAVRLVPGSVPARAGDVLALPAVPEDTAELVAEIRRNFGPCCALVDLRALGPASDAADLQGEIEIFFNLTKAFSSDLEDAAGSGGAVILGATALGGVFGFTGAEFDPSQAWRTGFLKTMAQEWPWVRAKAVDLYIGAPTGADMLAASIFSELFAADGLVEIGYGADQVRRTCTLVRDKLAPTASGLELNRDSVLLVTGGARGITAESALALARAYQPTLVLVGRTPEPAGLELPDTAGITEERALKQALFQQLRREGTDGAPAEIQARYSQLIREREVRETLERFAATGAKIVYRSCDVRDPSIFAALIEDVYARFGRIDGVLHGAGVIEDRLLADKTFESFRRVFETKVSGALVLAKMLRLDSLRFLVFFSSVSGRFGNRGQADYAAANEVLNKLAQLLDRRSPARVVAVNWGPWLTGMVTDEAKRQFSAKGVGLIPVDAGCRMLLEELSQRAISEPEVIIGAFGEAANAFTETLPVSIPAGGPGVPAQTIVPSRNGNHRVSLPLLGMNARIERTAGGIEVHRTISLEHDLYLADHVFDGKPVVPFAFALELMAEAAKAGWPELEILEVRDIRSLRGIVMDSPRDDLVVKARAIEMPGNGRSLHLETSIVARQDPSRVHYRSLVEMGHPQGKGGPPSTPGNGRVNGLDGAERLAWSMDRVYDEWLFHGTRLKAIATIEKLGPTGATAFLRASSCEDCLAGSPAGPWLIDPVLVDAAFQLQIVWCRKHWDVTILASSVASWRRAPGLYLPPRAGSRIRCELRIRPESDTPISHSDFTFYGPDERLLATMLDFQGTGSRSLNRLSTLVRKDQ